jgi:autotransporter adhesin
VGDSTYDNVGAAVTAAGLLAQTGSPDTVLYDGSKHDKLTFGGTASTTPVTLANVAAGTTTTDAVNFGQLSDLGMKVDSNGNALNAFVAYDNTSMDTISLKGKSGSTKITGLTNGTLSAASTDAVNGSQLFNTATSAADAIGGGSKLDPTTGKISKPSITVGTSTFDNLAGAIDAAGKSATQALTITGNAVMYNSTAHDKVTLGGTASTTPVTLANVAAGAAPTDAVNVSQLTDAMSKNTILTNQLKYIGFGPSQAAFANASNTDSMALGGNAYATADRALAIGLDSRAGYADSVAIGANSTVTAANTVSVGSAGAERKIMFVAAGTKTTDAVNLGQVQSMINGLTVSQQKQVLQSPVAMNVLGASNLLGASAQNWTDVLATGDTDKAGMTTAVGTDAMAIGLNTHATGAHATAIGQNTHADADGSVAVGNGAISNGVNATAVGVNASVTAVNALAAGFSAVGDAADSVAIGSGATVGKGADSSVAIGNEAVVTGAGSFALGNNTTVSGANSFVLGSDNVNVTGKNSVVLGSNSDGSQDNVVSVGAKNKERKIVNVAAGTTTTDAVNLGQMTSAIAAAGTGGGGSTLITQADTGADLRVGGATEGTRVNFASTSGVTRELTGVSAGTKATSAVNLSQLTPVVAGLGGGAAVDAAGNVTGPTYTIQGKTVNNAGEAFTKIDTNLTTLNSTVAGITGGGVGMVVQDPISHDITVGALNDGNTVNFAGTAGNRRLTGVAGGDVSSTSFDAINGTQLYNAASGLATAIGGGAGVNSDGTITQPSFIAGGQTWHNMGDAMNNIDGRVTTNTNSLTELQTTVNNITAGGGVATPNAVAYDTAAHDQLTLASTSGGTTKISGLTAGDISSADSTDAVTGGQLFATNQDVAALQQSVQNIGQTGAAGIGINGINGTNGADGTPAAAASATGNDAIAMGDNASASGDHAVVIGGGASGTGDGVIAIGGNSNASGTDSIAIGNNASAPANNAVALGANSVADRDNSVSMGSEGNERQVTNVAAGTRGTDAVNLNQMNSAIGGVARKAYSGIAAATALTMIPDVDANKTLSLGIGGGTFQGYAATAIGGTARITQNIKVRVGAGWSAAGTTVGAGASYQW